MSMIDNKDGTVSCTKCNETYLQNRPPEDIISRLVKGKRCEVCLGKIWEWVKF